MTRVAVRVLGPAQVRGRDGAAVPLTRQERRVVSALAAAGPTGLPVEALVEALWPDGPPPTARQSLHNHVHRIRRKVDGEVVTWRDDRYAIAPQVEVDATALVDLAVGARAALDDGAAATAVSLAEDARALCRGPALADLPPLDSLGAARSRLTALADEVADLHAEALLGAGRADLAVAELEGLIAEHPDREHRWVLLVRALRAQGRRTEALEAYHRARRLLVERHGVEPGPALRELQRLLLADPVGDGPPTRPAAIVPRDALVAEATAALQRHRRLWLHGGAGAGKSVAIGLVAASWDGGPVRRVPCAGSPWAALGPVAVLVEEVHEVLVRRGLPATLDAMTTATSAPRSGPGSRRAGSLADRAGACLGEALAEGGGTLLLIDDVHLAGPTSRAVLGAALARAGDAVAVVVTTRDATDPLPGWPADAPALAVPPLDAAELQALARGVGRDADPAAVAELARLSGGHPVIALELLHAGAEGAEGGEEGGEDDPAVPPRLRRLVAGRVARLPSRARASLAAAAVAGDGVAGHVLRRLVDVARLQPAVDDGLLVVDPGGGVRFANALYRQIAYDAVPPGRRAELHHAIGLHTTDPGARAAHLLAAAELDPQAATAAATGAAARLLDAGAHDDAADLFDRAAELASSTGAPPAEVLGLRLEGADARRLAGRQGHADALLDVAEAILDLDHVDLRRRAGLTVAQLGEAVDPGPAQQRAARVVDKALTGEVDDGWRARLAATSSQLHATAGDPDRCRELLLGAVAVAREDDEVLADVLPFAYMALGHPDDLPAREAIAERLRAVAARTGHPATAWEAAHLRFSCALARGDGAAARRVHAELEELTAQAPDAGRRWSAGYQRAALAVLDGELEVAEQLATEAMGVGQGVAPGRALAACAGQLLEIRRLQGRLPELADGLRHLVEHQPEIAAWQAAAAMVLAEVDPVRSRELLADLVAADLTPLPRDFTWLAGTMSLGRAAVVLGEADAARSLIGHLSPHADLACWQGTCTYGPVAEVLAGLGALAGDERTEGWAAQAAEVAARLAP